MSQHDYVISNDTGANVRSDLNNALGAIATINSGATEPSTTYAYQLWMDTSSNVLKIRNSANSAWYTLPISPIANNTVDINGGTVDGITSLTQTNVAADATDVELKYSGSTKLATTSTGIDVTGTVTADGLAVDTDTLYVDATNNRVGIGTSSPGYKCTVEQGTINQWPMAINNASSIGGQARGLIIRYTNGVGNYSSGTGSNFLGFYDSASSEADTARLICRGSGNLENYNNSYGALSDIKLKENIVDATPKLDDINKLRVVNFNFIGSQDKQLGLIAQEVEQIFPGLIDENPDEDADGNDLGTTTKAVKYSVFTPMLIKALQEAVSKIEALETRIAALEA